MWCHGSTRTADCVSDRHRLRVFSFPAKSTRRSVWLSTIVFMRDNYWHVGGGLSYSFSRMDVFASYIAFVGGTDTHAGRALHAGISWPFEVGDAHAH